MKLGFIVGKFYPPHHGHKFLIESARAQVDQLIVLIAAHPSQSIPGEIRQRWLQEIHPDCDIRLVPDELENDSESWAQFTLKYLGRAPDVVFTSEDYGPKFASFMGSQHVSIDRHRRKAPISGTQIRQSPFKYFNYLEPCVRAWYVSRVVFIGAESTGKTTLAEKLAHHYRTQWVPEYGREHWENKVAGLAMDGPLPSWSPEEFLHIAITQQQREWQTARECRRLLVCDTNAFATGTWYERYFQTRHAGVDRIGKNDRVALYLLTRPDVPFVQDGFRDGEKIRGWMDNRFESLLQAGSVPYVSLSGDYGSRLTQAIDAVDAMLREGVTSSEDSKVPR